MNQILQVNNKNNNKSKNVKDIILFLVIIIIVFGVGIGGYAIFKNIDLPIFTDTPNDTTIINLTKVDTNKLVIKAQSDKGISKLAYNLNNEIALVLELTGENVVEESIDMKVGENTIVVSVTDAEGRVTTKQESFVVEAIKPIIELSVIGNDIKVTVTSDVELDLITYQWNSDEPKKVNMSTYENRLLFEKQLEIPIGQNALTIVATDVNGLTTEKTQEIKGVTKATTTIEVVGQYLHFTVEGKENIQEVRFELNGQKFLMNTTTFGETKKVHYKVKLVEGKNYLTITSRTQSGGVDVTSWEEEYTK